MATRTCPTTSRRLRRLPRRSIGGPSLGGIIPSGFTAVKMVVEGLTPRVYTDVVGQFRRSVDGLDAERCLAWANEFAPDAVPSFEAWAQPE